MWLPGLAGKRLGELFRKNLNVFDENNEPETSVIKTLQKIISRNGDQNLRIL